MYSPWVDQSCLALRPWVSWLKTTREEVSILRPTDFSQPKSLKNKPKKVKKRLRSTRSQSSPVKPRKSSKLRHASSSTSSQSLSTLTKRYSLESCSRIAPMLSKNRDLSSQVVRAPLRLETKTWASRSLPILKRELSLCSTPVSAWPERRLSRIWALLPSQAPKNSATL